MLQLFNTFSSKKEEFKSFEKNLVKIFICGPTLYDYTHLGHARIFLTYDLLCRLLHDNGYATDVLVNMTDINQNVFNKAKEKSDDYSTIARFYSSQFITDLALLNINSITRLAHVSDYVSSMEKEISKLVEQNIAYSANGNIYLDVSKVKDYGIMSKQSKEQLNLHRLDIGPHKKNQEDIMLWNCSEDLDSLGIVNLAKAFRGGTCKIQQWPLKTLDETMTYMEVQESFCIPITKHILHNTNCLQVVTTL